MRGWFIRAKSRLTGAVSAGHRQKWKSPQPSSAATSPAPVASKAALYQENRGTTQ